jgi:hypothetical protein
MRIEFLLEEPSAEAALQILLPKILGSVPFAMHAHNGKHDLLAKLPGRLKGYRRWMQRDMRIVVLVDNDQDDCRALKARLEHAALAAGFPTKSSPSRKRRFEVLNRLAIEELEAWYFGDADALVAAYPGLPATLASQAKYRDPDAISGGTWEALERLLQRAGYYPGGMPKVETARNVSLHMDPQRNRSRSFQVFRDGLLALARAGQ